MAKKINAFMTFVHEWRRNNAGGRPMSLPEAVNRCGDVWQVMTIEERSPYVEQARIINLQQRGQRNQKLFQMDLDRREAEERLEKMKRATETMVREAVHIPRKENCDSDPEMENKSSMGVPTDIMAGFGRGRTRRRVPTLGEANH